MAKLVTIRGCGPMVCSSYHEFSAAIDQAYAGPKDRPLVWRGITASLARGLDQGIHPLREMAELEKALRVAAVQPRIGPDISPGPG